jgi:hypothetical protein
MDKREQILQRLLQVAADVLGVVSVARNRDEISERARPAIAVFDADETIDERPKHKDTAVAPRTSSRWPQRY